MLTYKDSLSNKPVYPLLESNRYEERQQKQQQQQQEDETNSRVVDGNGTGTKLLF